MTARHSRLVRCPVRPIPGATANRLSWRLRVSLVSSLVSSLLLPSTLPAEQKDPDLKTVLRRAADYVADYHEKLSSIIAEERYVQRTGNALGPSIPGPQTDQPAAHERRLVSDFVIVPGLAVG